jgi:hypothetical protein
VRTHTHTPRAPTSHGDDDDDDDGDVRKGDTDDYATTGGDATSRGANDERTRRGDSRVPKKRNELGRSADGGRTRDRGMDASEER